MFRELCKFFAGITAWEAVVHASLGLSGVLPISLFGIVITPFLNTIQIIVPALMSCLLIYLGWLRKSDR
jgi:hypothetical protein